MGPIWPGGGGGEGVLENQRKYEKVKKLKSKEANEEQMFSLNCGAMFSKIGGLNGWAFTVVLSTTVQKIVYKT